MQILYWSSISVVTPPLSPSPIPYITIDSPHLTNRSSISTVNLCRSYIDLLYQRSVLHLCLYITSYPIHITNWSSISMVNLLTNRSSISVVCPLPLLYIASSPPDLYWSSISVVNLRTHWSSISVVCPLSRTSTITFSSIWPIDLLYLRSTYADPYWSSISVVTPPLSPSPIPYITIDSPHLTNRSSISTVNLCRPILIFYISGHSTLSTSPIPLHYHWFSTSDQ